MSSFSALRATLIGCLLLSSTVAANARFKEGSDDGTHGGHSSSQLLGRSMFVGGSDDGTSVGLAIAQLVGRNVFVGGADDGTSLGLAAALEHVFPLVTARDVAGRSKRLCQ